MVLLAATLQRGDEIGALEDPQVLRDRLPGHAHLLAELAERLAAARVEPVEQFPPAGVRERLEDFVHAGGLGLIMQVIACMSSGLFPPWGGGSEYCRMGSS